MKIATWACPAIGCVRALHANSVSSVPSSSFNALPQFPPGIRQGRLVFPIGFASWREAIFREHLRRVAPEYSFPPPANSPLTRNVISVYYVVMYIILPIVCPDIRPESPREGIYGTYLIGRVRS